MQRLRRAFEANPEAWNKIFDDTIERSLGSDIAGSSWSLFDYILKRVQFQKQDEDLEKFLVLLANLHAIH